MVEIKQLNSLDSDFWQQLEALLAWEAVSDTTVNDTVKEILAQVKSKGDQAVLDYSRRFDRVNAKTIFDLEIPLSRGPSCVGINS